jgi:hypothetical protein
MPDILLIAIYAVAGFGQGYLLRQVFKLKFVPGEDAARRNKRNLTLGAMALLGIAASLYIADYATRDDASTTTLAFAAVAVIVGVALGLVIKMGNNKPTK